MSSIAIKKLSQVAITIDNTAFPYGASGTLVTGRKLYAWFCLAIGAGTPADPTAAGTNGLNGTWTLIPGSVVDEGTRKMGWFRSTATDTVSGVLTITAGNGPETIATCIGELFEVTSIGSETPVQTQVNSGAAITTLSVTMSAFADPWNATLAATAIATSFANPVTPGMMREFGTGTGGPSTSESLGGVHHFYPAHFTTPLATFASTTALMSALELDHDASDLSAGGSFTGGMRHVLL